jgi:flagellar basal-body rod modification protein FlgD
MSTTSSTGSVTSNLSDLPATTSGAATTSKNTLGKDDFLKLLTTQMQYQDPLNPMDNSQFVTQLAQYSSVEQLQNLGSRMDTLLVAEATTNQLTTASLVGKQVLYHTDSVHLTSGSPAQLQLSLEGAAAATSVVISDASGRVVRTLDLGANDAGTVTATWDGRDGSGNLLPSGTYTISAAAKALDGSTVGMSTRVRGTVDGVTFQSGATQLLVGGATIKMSDVVEITSPAPTP